MLFRSKLTEGDEFRSDRYFTKVAFEVNTENAIGESLTSVRTAWLNSQAEHQPGDVVNIDTKKFVPVGRTYETKVKTDTEIYNEETGESTYLGSSLNFMPTEDVKSAYLAGKLTKRNGLFYYKYDLPEGFAYRK